MGHVIKGGGIALSGQEQRQLGGGFLEGNEAPSGKLNNIKLYRYNTKQYCN